MCPACPTGMSPQPTAHPDRATHADLLIGNGFAAALPREVRLRRGLLGNWDAFTPLQRGICRIEAGQQVCTRTLALLPKHEGLAHYVFSIPQSARTYRLAECSILTCLDKNRPSA
jgi:hypothetical protein